MSKTWKRLLSLLLAVVMVLSLGISGFAIDDKDDNDVKPIDPETLEEMERIAALDADGTRLGLEEVDPSTLSISKLGEIEQIDLEGESETDALYGDDDIVRVSIFLEDPATVDAGFSTKGVGTNAAAVAYRDSLKAEQVGMQAAIESATGSTLDVKWNLTLLVNAISANVRYGDIEMIESVPGVKSVELETRYEPQKDDTNTAVTTSQMIFATNVWAEGYTGAGSKIAIIDTGTNQDHISFDAAGLEYSLVKGGKSLSTYDLLTADKIREVADQLNVDIDVSKVYKNTKIPYAYNYIDENYVTDHDSDSQGEHGSHVSGIAAANRYVLVDGEFVDAVSAVGAVGVAPDAQIVTMKVFGAGGGAYDSDYMAAIEDAVVLGCDSANLSLGGGAPGFAFAGGYQEIMDKLVNSGTVVSISAGNAYGWYDTPYNSVIPAGYIYSEDVSLHTGGSPGSFVNSLGVASADNVGTTGSPLIYNGDQDVFFTETSSTGAAAMASIAGEYEYVYIDGVGNAAEYAAVNAVVPLEGKIVMTNRGSISFYVKGNNLISYKPAALVVANNVDGTINMALDSYTGSFPMVAITLADAEAIKEASESGTAGNYTYYTGTVEVTANVKAVVTTDLKDATISSFSSWGGPGSLLLKPEITAPGGSIWSVNGMTDDGYENMSGTSMAAPQVAGMAALIGQYYTANADKFGGNDQRTIANSLLMSTAVPMKNNGSYISVLRQGAGLANVSSAVKAKSYILMSSNATVSAADGKVKAELGDDPDRTGSYSYSFSITNTSDQTLVYEFSTDLFTQAIEADSNGTTYLSKSTTPLSAGVSYYIWDVKTPDSHDVNKDGVTDAADAQAILDYLTGNVDGETLDLEAAEVDGEEGITTNDAYALLQSLDELGDDQLALLPGETNTVTVYIQLSGLEALDENYVNGAYVEGFTYVTCISQSDDGEILDVQHSIPILGFYGSWTDSSMFDVNSVLDVLYGTATKASYTRNNNTNYVQVRYPGGTSDLIYTGNPYVVEEEFPTERLAVSNDTVIKSVTYSLIRNAGTVGAAALKLDEEGNGSVVYTGSLSNNVTAAYYYVNGGSWYNTAASSYKVNQQVNEFGLDEGDSFTFGLYAIPEYNAMKVNGATSGNLSKGELKSVLESGDLGEGAYVGYTFTVDDTAPTVYAAILSKDGKTLSVATRDENYIAYIGIMDLSGNTIYAGGLPEQSESGELVTVKFDLSEIEDANAIILFVADYAANETARLVRLSDGPIMMDKDYFYLTDTLEADKEYLIVSANEAGTGYVLTGNGASAAVSAETATIKESEEGLYIAGDKVQSTAVWTALDEEDGWFMFQNSSDGTYLGWYSTNSPYYCWTSAVLGDAFSYTDNKLIYSGTRGILFNGTNFVYSTAGEVYLYEKVTRTEEIDPDNASEVEVTPDTLKLFIGAIPEADLVATVQPIYLDDRTVTWSSSDESVATVDQKGHVTAVGAGVATITATSNKTPTVSGTATVEVLAGTPIDSYIFGQYTIDDVPVFGAVMLNDMSTVDLYEADESLVGGGRSGNSIFGIDTDDYYVRYDFSDDYEELILNTDASFAMNTAYAPWDATAFPHYTITETSENEDGETEETSYTFDFDAVAISPSGYFQLMKGSSLSYFNLSSLGSFVGVAYAGYYNDEENGITNVYLLLRSDGDLLVFAVYGDIEGDLSANYGILGHINVFEIGDDLSAYSISYGVTGVDSILIADNSIKGIWYVDMSGDGDEFDASFVGAIDGASNLAALFGAFDAAASLDGADLAPAGVSSVLTSNTLQAAYVNLAPEAEETVEDADIVDTNEIAEPVEDDEIIIVDDEEAFENEDEAETEPAGSLNAIRNYVPISTSSLRLVNTGIQAVAPETDEEGAVTVTITADELAHNGLYTITFDSDALTYVVVDTDLTCASYNEDEGTIKFAFADKTGVAADETVAVVKFTVSCEDTTISVVTNEFNTTLTAGEPEETTVKGIGHDWEFVDFTWTGDDENGYTAAVANFKCKNVEAHVKSVDATVSSELDNFGNTVYTAVVTAEDSLDGEEHTDTKTIEATGFHITVVDYTKGAATTGIEADKFYKGDVTFTVSADLASLIVIDNGDGTYTRVTVTTTDDEHEFTLNVTKDVTIVVVFKGDANLDGKVSTKDATLIKQFVVGIADLEAIQLLSGDANGDGKVSTKDATLIKQFVVQTATIDW